MSRPTLDTRTVTPGIGGRLLSDPAATGTNEFADLYEGRTLNDEVTAHAASTGPLVDRAVRLFTYLGRAQGLKAARVHDLETYRRDGAVHWLHDAPAHPAVRLASPDASPGDPVLTVERIPRLAPPEPAEAEHHLWIDGPLDQSDREPTLLAFRVIPVDGEDAADGEPTSRRVEIAERPEVAETHRVWLLEWRAWAEQHRRDEPVRTLYGALFSTYVTFTGHPEELELVVGTGLLTWAPESHPAVRRHLLVGAARIVFDDDTGRLSVMVDDTVPGTGVELEMLDPGLIGRPQRVAEIREQARDDTTHPLNREHAGELARRLVHLLSADAGYLDDDAPPTPSVAPVASFAPALLLRRRSQRGLMEIFERIVEQIRSSGRVPDGIRPLIDPDHEPRNAADNANTDGALVRMDDDLFAPLPVNPTQLRVLERVDSTAQTLIQGPPGTGKTHTAAVLISHLLAQGKRVLVTAQTDRALKEVRQKLPEAVRPLAVAVVGSSREDMSDLRVAVERIAGAAADHDDAASRAEIARRLQDVDALRRRRARLSEQLRIAREREVGENEIDGYRGTLAAIARRRAEQRESREWIEDFDIARSSAPLSDVEIAELRSLLLDDDLQADEPDSELSLLPAAQLLEAESFSELVATQRRTTTAAERFRNLGTHPALVPITDLSSAERDRLSERLREVRSVVHAVVGRREAWVHEAVSDIRSGRLSLWTGRLDDITRRIAQAQDVVAGLGHDVRVSGSDPSMLAAAARGVGDYLAGGARIKLGGDGMPKLGAFASRNLKNAATFFDRVRVDGLAPTTSPQVEAFLQWVDADRQLDALDRAWPGSITIPEEDTVTERLQWHVTERSLLRQVTDLGHMLGTLSADLTSAGIPVVDWFDLSALDAYCALPDAARADLTAADARRPIDEFADRVAKVVRTGPVAPILGRMAEAIGDRSEAAYASARARVVRLHAVRVQLDRREQLRARLGAQAPVLAAALVARPEDERWDDRLPRFTESWNWSRAGTWLSERDVIDVNAIQDEIGDVEQAVRSAAESLAATRAWGHAVAPDRLTRGSRASLEQYAALVRRFGKTGGQYREQRRAEIREAMDRCRPAVPVWIMPIYRIADQLRVEPGMFDVVVVDEASQAGLEATFLQYLAPRIVVIGDDKQVSPSAVGVDQQQLRDLGNQYLYDDPFRATWQDPQRSLFDEAKMRFSGMLTLIEHRRCVPEIIEFSNRVAYEPDGVRLVPVRQYGADRLDPIRTVHVTDGYERGSSSSRTNPPEVEAVVEQIEKCLADPRYDGLSMGVISLLGAGQARAIEKSLLERVPPEEWTARDLRCGDAADFQGSERDIIFLSMVAAPDPDRRTTALTAALYVQRYNVAASRAKDQLWLFHSIDPTRLGNPEDMRFQLLDHCYSVQRRALFDDEGLSTETVSEDVTVPPFASTFEQRVHNRIVERGYPVLPHHTTLDHEIDLVVVGSGSRLAVECDADAWDGPEAHQRDMSRQRELQRCGWNFFRVSEAEFCLDPDATLDGLWARLTELGIRPRVEEVAEPEPASDPGPPAAMLLVDQDTDAPTGPIDLTAIREGLVTSRSTVPQDELVGQHVLDEPIASADPVGPAEVVEDDEDTPLPDREIATAVVHIEDAPDAAPAHRETPPVAEDRDVSTSAPTSGAGPLRHVGYTDFDGVVTPALEATRADIVDGLVQIVAVEGPILGSRLHTVYVRASGQRRTGALIAKALNVAITAAVRQGKLVQDDPLREPGVKPRTFRLPEQAEVRVRTSGSRTFDQIPPAEVAAVLVEVGVEIGWNDPTEVYRTVLSRYGIAKLGSHIRQRLDAITVGLVDR